MSDKLPNYGGQAVIEGVMMRGAQAVAIAMRSPDQEIVIHTEKLGGIYKSRLAKIPFLRGFPDGLASSHLQPEIIGQDIQPHLFPFLLSGGRHGKGAPFLFWLFLFRFFHLDTIWLFLSGRLCTWSS